MIDVSSILSRRVKFVLPVSASETCNRWRSSKRLFLRPVPAQAARCSGCFSVEATQWKGGTHLNRTFCGQFSGRVPAFGADVTNRSPQQISLVTPRLSGRRANNPSPTSFSTVSKRNIPQTRGLKLGSLIAASRRQQRNFRRYVRLLLCHAILMRFPLCGMSPKILGPSSSRPPSASGRTVQLQARQSFVVGCEQSSILLNLTTIFSTVLASCRRRAIFGIFPPHRCAAARELLDTFVWVAKPSSYQRGQ